MKSIGLHWESWGSPKEALDITRDCLSRLDKAVDVDVAGT